MIDSQCLYCSNIRPTFLIIDIPNVTAVRQLRRWGYQIKKHVCSHCLGFLVSAGTGMRKEKTDYRKDEAFIDEIIEAVRPKYFIRRKK